MAITNLKLKIEATLVTPMTQIESSEQRPNKNKPGEKVNITTVKTRAVLDDKYGIVKLPIYTGNGFRGLLRRKMSEIILEKALKKGIKPTRDDYYFMVAGGGANYQKQDFDVVEKVRFLNPVISVLGTSLAVPGKLIVTDLLPVNYDSYLYAYRRREEDFEDEDNYNKAQNWGCSLIKTLTFSKKDDVLDQTKFGRFISPEDVKAWEKFMENETSEEGKERKTIRSFLSKEYVVPGTKFRGFIGSKEPLTEIEYGLVLKGLMDLTNENLGAGAANGFGVANYNIYSSIDEKEIISSLVNERFILERTVESPKSEYEKHCIFEFEKWLENLTDANINVSGLMKSTEKKKAEKNIKKSKNQAAEA